MSGIERRMTVILRRLNEFGSFAAAAHQRHTSQWSELDPHSCNKNVSQGI